jgi:transposase
MDREKRETVFAEQYLKFLDSNLKPKVAFEKMQKMGYTGTRSTMNRHIASLRRTGHALSLVKKDSSHSLLNDHQMSIVNSWISDQNTNNRPIGYSDVQKFIYDTFSFEVCIRTAGNILHRLGHTQKTCQSKTSGFKKPNAELKTEYWEFITTMKKENRFVREPAEIRLLTRRNLQLVLPLFHLKEDANKELIRKRMLL